MVKKCDYCDEVLDWDEVSHHFVDKHGLDHSHCKDCGEPIIWDERGDKVLPIDGDEHYHDCEAPRSCKYCGDDIRLDYVFDDDRGEWRWLPFDYYSEDRHYCENQNGNVEDGGLFKLTSNLTTLPINESKTEKQITNPANNTSTRLRFPNDFKAINWQGSYRPRKRKMIIECFLIINRFSTWYSSVH